MSREHWNVIQCAILGKRVITFSYYNRNGEQSTRRIEPHQLLFKQNHWYVIGYCEKRQKIRNFKLSRIKNLQITEEVFEHKQFLEKEEPEFTNCVKYVKINLVLKIHTSQAYRVYDEFDEGQIIKNTDDTFTVRATCTDNEWVYGNILSYGPYAEVLEPEYIRMVIKTKLQEAAGYYI